MRWASSISDAPDLESALELACDELHTQLGEVRPDLLLAFVGHRHQAHWHRLPERLRERWPTATLIGCSAGGVLGRGRELEDRAGVALMAARLPGVEITPFHVSIEQMLVGEADPAALRQHWSRTLGLREGPDPHLILLPDPFTWPGPQLLADLDAAFPTGVKIGGLASGGDRAGEHRLFCDRSTHHRGLVGVALRGNLEIDAVVAQGCRAIGQPMFVTRHQRNVISELDGRPAIEALQRLFDELEPSDRVRARHSLSIGLVVGRGCDRLALRGHGLALRGHGDFLIRNLVGVDPITGGQFRQALVDKYGATSAATAGILHWRYGGGDMNCLTTNPNGVNVSLPSTDVRQKKGILDMVYRKAGGGKYKLDLFLHSRVKNLAQCASMLEYRLGTHSDNQPASRVEATMIDVQSWVKAELAANERVDKLRSEAVEKRMGKGSKPKL